VDDHELWRAFDPSALERAKRTDAREWFLCNGCCQPGMLRFLGSTD
jgi:hypothetical protein